MCYFEALLIYTLFIQILSGKRKDKNKRAVKFQYPGEKLKFYNVIQDISRIGTYTYNFPAKGNGFC